MAVKDELWVIYLSVSKATNGFSSGLWSKEEQPLLGTTSLEKEKERQLASVTYWNRFGKTCFFNLDQYNKQTKNKFDPPNKL